ncbi:MULTISPECIES: penicillin-binding transpeptidase domain-containing protein [unclassified Ruminococcus]|uniref:penicillin-binding transpeptidase domain-containing protein n=1 Tax=unclassified Ruminococcus TaxID=2608920 RepID=UPI00210EAA19|nr:MULTISPECIES: penicillin-binding transpeptidase domain-containing protein [unclassified Ruminococcus]MCQ4021415.1 penicillin-binding protein [Ruminococcus sp. zg-924]MCQ4113860.1 penicillin-binding protein [Ruminococcus sp. zg-921]
MKQVRTRSMFVFVLVLLFFAGIIYFTVNICINADSWVQHSYNGHTSGSGGLEKAGKIFDRNGVVLAQTVDGSRIYNEDYDTRLSTLHVVGDNSLNISTAVQSVYRSELTGFSYIWGLEMPQSFRGGNNLTLTIDSDACKTAYNALGGMNGAVVVMNYKTGEILCSVSCKTYDPQNPPELTEENESEYDGAYLNHVLSSSYTPGSIFKIVTAAAALENMPDIDSRTFECNGSAIIGGEEVTCMAHHGTINLDDGLAQSCNIVFAQLAYELGRDKMTAAANELGVNSSYDIGHAPTVKGQYDVKNASDNDLAWSGIGQYTDLTNPMQMCILMSAIANGGNRAEPYYVQSISGSDYSPFTGTEQSGKAMLKSSTAQKLNDMMRYTVSSNYGDYMFGGNLTVCAKTGTAEVKEGESNDAWIVGFTRDEDVPLAFAVVVEDGNFGLTTAGPVASAAIQACAQTLRN